MIPYCILTIPAVAYIHLIHTVVAIHNLGSSVNHETAEESCCKLSNQPELYHILSLLSQILTDILTSTVNKLWPFIAFQTGSSNCSAMHVLTVWPQWYFRL